MNKKKKNVLMATWPTLNFYSDFGKKSKISRDQFGSKKSNGVRHLQ